MSKRGRNWMVFALKVANHVENYTVPQYGDAPDDQVENWSVDDCLSQIAKYVARSGRNQRGPVEQLRDIIKIAHYASLAHEKLEKKEG